MVWFLTPAGRIQARDEYGIGSSLYSKDALLKCYDIPQIDIDCTKIQNDIKYYIEKSKERIDSIIQGRDQQNENDVDKNVDFNDANKENIEFDEADIGLPNNENYQSNLEDIENLIFEKAAKLIPHSMNNKKNQ